MSVPLLPLTHLKGHTPMAKADRVEMWRLLGRFFESGVQVAGQNWKFDHEKLLRPCNFRIPEQPAHDTLILMHVLNPEFPKRLDFISSIYTREPYYKDEGKTFDPRKDSIDQYYYYNAKDSAVQMECLEEMLKEADERGLREYYETVRMPQHRFFMEMEQNGLPVDNDKRIALFHKYTDMELALEEKLFSLAGWKINVRSRTDVPLLLYKELQLPVRKKADEDTLVALLGNNLARDPELQQRPDLDSLGLRLGAVALQFSKRRYVLIQWDSLSMASRSTASWVVTFAVCLLLQKATSLLNSICGRLKRG
jgi:DNA polymerase I-like protein with 3'-5' exonuclease and polymerase domains